MNIVTEDQWDSQERQWLAAAFGGGDFSKETRARRTQPATCCKTSPERKRAAARGPRHLGAPTRPGSGSPIAAPRAAPVSMAIGPPSSWPPDLFNEAQRLFLTAGKGDQAGQ